MSQQTLGKILVESISLILLFEVLAAELLKDQDNSATCNKLMKNAYYNESYVVGKVWRVYYSWNVEIEPYCMDMRFNNATRYIIQRFKTDMQPYLKRQPKWEAASLHLIMGRDDHELLLIPNPRKPGRFAAVINIWRSLQRGESAPKKKSTPLTKFIVMLVPPGRFLLAVDCSIGVAALCTERGNAPHRGELASVARTLRLGKGMQSCKQEVSPY